MVDYGKINLRMVVSHLGRYVELRIPININPILQEFRNINEEFLNR